jgi:hypothetical protein
MPIGGYGSGSANGRADVLQWLHVSQAEGQTRLAGTSPLRWRGIKLCEAVDNLWTQLSSQHGTPVSSLCAEVYSDGFFSSVILMLE